MTESHVSWMTVLYCYIMWFHKSRGTKNIIHIRACFFTWGKARGVPNGGWATVREYEANSIADNSDDDKKIKQADSRTVKAIKEKSKSRPRPYLVPQKPEPAPNPVFSESYSRRPVQQPPFRGNNARRGPCEWDMFRMQGIWALEDQLPQHKYIQLRDGEKVDRIRISTPQQIIKISILLILLFLSGEVIVTQISISL